MEFKELTSAGINIDELLQRIMQNTALLKILIAKFLEDTNYENLKAAIASGDMQSAEHACHTLKGMCGNLSLKALFDTFVNQLAFFRAGEYDMAIAMMDGICADYDNATAHMRTWLSQQ